MMPPLTETPIHSISLIIHPQSRTLVLWLTELRQVLADPHHMNPHLQIHMDRPASLGAKGLQYNSYSYGVQNNTPGAV